MIAPEGDISPESLSPERRDVPLHAPVVVQVFGYASASVARRGIAMVNSVYIQGSLSTVIVPPCAFVTMS